MREILYRAKTSSKVNGFNIKKDGIWVYGFYRDRVGLPTISEFDTAVADYIDYEIDSSTLSQSCGLKDENGKYVFEGDYIKMHYFFDNYDPSTLGAYEDENCVEGFVICDINGFYIIDDGQTYPLSYMQDSEAECVIIGNRWDNPELLEDN